jgi:hypothetical protein
MKADTGKGASRLLLWKLLARMVRDKSQMVADERSGKEEEEEKAFARRRARQ